MLFMDDFEESEMNPLQISCSQGHRSSFILHTQEGGFICLLCFTNLISNPHAPTLHVSYALSQFSQALSQPRFLSHLLSFHHSNLLVSPLIIALSSFEDEPIAHQVIDLVVSLCGSAGDAVHGQFVAKVSDQIASGALAWSRRQVYMMHCFGLLLNSHTDDLYSHIQDTDSLVSNLAAGLQLPCEEIRGEILFILHKLSIIEYVPEGRDGTDLLFPFCPKLLHVLLEILMKTQSDDIRLNCVALLTVLAQRGYLESPYANDTSSRVSYEPDNLMSATEDGIDGPPLNVLFAESIKGPLLSSDIQVQLNTLCLIFHYLSSESAPGKQFQVLVEENIADYVFEILRLSECKDPVVSSCLQVLDLLSAEKQGFRQKLAIGFATLVPVLCYVAEVPFHPVQSQTLNLILNCICDCPGVVSTSHVEELVLVLTRLLKRHTDGQMDILPETFITVCLIFVALLKSPSCYGNSNLIASIQEASKCAVLSCLSTPEEQPCPFLHSLYLLKEVYGYINEKYCTEGTSNKELRNGIVDVCATHLLPWLLTAINRIEEEEIILAVLETFHSILLQNSDNQVLEFAENLISSSWFRFSFGCLGLFPDQNMKLRVYMFLGSLVDVLLGNDSGKPIRDAALYLPSDPIDLLFLLRQKSSINLELHSSQSAVLLILYISSLYNERLADEKLVLASLEQCLIVNSSDFISGAFHSLKITQLVSLYGLYKGLAKMSYQMPYSPEAESILFHLVTGNEWNLTSARIHTASLKWLFQQEKMSKSLSRQILKLCITTNSNGKQVIIHGNNSQLITVQTTAELVAAGDNYGAKILVCLLKELLEERGQEHDTISVVKFMVIIVKIIPVAADQLCLHGLGNSICTLFHSSSATFSPHIFTAILHLIFNILRSVNTQTLYDDDSWLLVTRKLMDHLISTVSKETWTPEALLVVGIFSLILHHSTYQALIEAAKRILLNTSLNSAINDVVYAACSKGHTLIDQDEGTKTGETLIFGLLLYYFSLKSMPAVLPGIVDWQNFLETSNMQSFALISIRCQDLCRLLHFGSHVVKLIASYCLLELFTRLSDQIHMKNEELKCTMEYLMSVAAVLEGLIFYGDTRVATNCSLCLSMILGWENLNMQETKVIQKDSWCRLISEELAMSLAAPCLASRSFTNHHKPAVQVAVALLKLKEIPGWMRSVFDDPCIYGIMENFASGNVSTEIVFLFRELLNSEFLKTEQIGMLNRVFQVCRKRKYTENAQDACIDENSEKVFHISNEMEEACECLLHLMSYESSIDMDSRGLQIGNKSLLDEIEIFLKTLTVEDNG